MKLFCYIAVCAVIDRAVTGYEWDCQPGPNGTLRIPGSLGYDVDSSIPTLDTVGAEVNIYPVKGIDETCYNRSVTAVEFCYKYSVSGGGEPYFNWTVLILDDDGSGPFTIKRLFSIESRPSDLIRSDTEACGAVSRGRQHCCDKKLLTRPFTLETDFAFGVTESARGNTYDTELLAFHHSVYAVDSVQLNGDEVTLSVGSHVRRDATLSRGLRMLWFVVDGNSPTSGTRTVNSATTDDMTLTNTTTDAVVTSFESDSVTAAIIAGCIAFVAIVIIMVIIVAVTLVMCRRQRQKSKPMVLLPFTNDAGYARVLHPLVDMSIGDERIPVTSYRAYSNISETDVNMLRYANEGLFKESTDKEDEKDDVAFWEPADTVNELYKQLSSKKYKEISRKDLELTGKLGSGQFGVVRRGIWQSPMGALDVAVKQLQPGASEEEKVKFLQEAAINGQFRHPNVVHLIGVVTVGEPAVIVLEMLSNGDLANFLVKQRSELKNPESTVDRSQLLRFSQHIASGMSYLAGKSFVHRDLAARNVLVSKDQICKISDFGMSRNLKNQNHYLSRGGQIPVKWTAPEAIKYMMYSTASDVWSFGCVMYEIWSLGHTPFEKYTNSDVFEMVEQGYRLPPPPGLSKELYKIIIQCWQPESSQRPTFPQLVELLSRADYELFMWEEADLKRMNNPQVKEIGAPLDTAKELYQDLQRSYMTL